MRKGLFLRSPTQGRKIHARHFSEGLCLQRPLSPPLNTSEFPPIINDTPSRARRLRFSGMPKFTVHYSPDLRRCWKEWPVAQAQEWSCSCCTTLSAEDSDKMQFLYVFAARDDFRTPTKLANTIMRAFEAHYCWRVQPRIVGERYCPHHALRASPPSLFTDSSVRRTDFFSYLLSRPAFEASLGYV